MFSVENYIFISNTKDQPNYVYDGSPPQIGVQLCQYRSTGDRGKKNFIEYLSQIRLVIIRCHPGPCLHRWTGHGYFLSSVWDSATFLFPFI